MDLEQQRDPDGELGRKHGDTIIATLRGIYGASFAPDCQPTDMLSDVLAQLDEPSLTQLVQDHQAGRLDGKLAEQS